MKKFEKILFIIILLSIPAISQAKTFIEGEYSYSADSTKEQATICYEVFGMDCPGCESALEKQLKKIEGIEDVKASWEKQQVEIWMSDILQIEQKVILERIKKANFTPGEKKAIKNDEE